MNLNKPYSAVKCNNKRELSFVLDYAESINKHVSNSIRSFEKYPVLIYLSDEIVSWNDSMDRIGKKYSFIELVEYINESEASELAEPLDKLMEEE